MVKKTKKQHNSRKVLITAGASGGHIFPALAVADELRSRGVDCVFVIGGGRFTNMLQEAGYTVETLPAAPWNVKNPLRKLWSGLNLLAAFIKAMALINKYHPNVVFGSGGYATVATILAARFSGVPSMIQDQNVLPGRANRKLAKFVDKIALSWESSRQYFPAEVNMVVCGNPVRKEVLAVRKNKRADDGNINLLIVGGSLGARVMSDVVPAAIARLSPTLRKKITITQQARPEDVERVQNAYVEMGIAPGRFNVRSFFDDLPELMVQSHLIIGRSGASTVGECALLGRPAIFVPLKLADGHQRLNAAVMEQEGAAIIIDSDNFNAQALTDELEALLNDPEGLHNMETAAKAIAQPKAAENVATEVMNLASLDVMYIDFQE